MSFRTFSLSLLLVSAVPCLGAQTLPRDTEQVSARPLNLSVRKQTAPTSDTAQILLEKEARARSQASSDSASPAQDDVRENPLPYGSGFESRQQGSTSGDNDATSGGRGAGGHGGHGGHGGSGGRGGSGRGR